MCNMDAGVYDARIRVVLVSLCNVLEEDIGTVEIIEDQMIDILCSQERMLG